MQEIMYDVKNVESSYTRYRNNQRIDAAEINEYVKGLKHVLDSLLLDAFLAEKIIYIMDLCLIINGPDDGIYSAINYCEKYLSNSKSINQAEFDFMKPYPYEIHDNIGVCHVFNPSVESFSSGIPFFTPKMASSWPAVEKWTFEYLSSQYGHRLVPVEVGESYLSEDWSVQLISLRECLQRLEEINSNNYPLYMAQFDLLTHIPKLRADLRFPYILPVHDHLQVIENIWIGNSKSKTPFHFDRYDNLFVQLTGKKKFYLCPQSLFPKSEVVGNSSQLSPQDLFKKGIPVLEIYLSSGDGLFIPRNYWHYAEGLSANISVSFWF